MLANTLPLINTLSPVAPDSCALTPSAPNTWVGWGFLEQALQEAGIEE